MPNVVDAHLQVWNPDSVHYPWMTAENAGVHRTYRVPDIEDQLADEDVAWVVLVQAADNRADSELMLFQALSSPRVAGVVAWVPLDAPDDAATQLDKWRREPIVGHRPPRARRPRSRLAARRRRRRQPDAPHRATTDPRPHGAHADGPGPRRDPRREPPQAHRRPRPPRRSPARRAAGRRPGRLERAGPPCWAPSRSCRTSSPSCPGWPPRPAPGWTPDHLRPAVDRALEVFGPDRLMLGSDWPYALLEGDSYAQVWHGLRSTVDQLGDDDRAAVLGGTATAGVRAPVRLVLTARPLGSLRVTFR